MEKYPEASTTPGIVVLRLDAPLFFANTAHFETKINQNIEEGDKEARAAGGELSVQAWAALLHKVCLCVGRC